MLSSHGGFLTIVMYQQWRNNLIKLTHYGGTKKRAHDSQIVRAKENLKLSHGGPISYGLLGEYSQATRIYHRVCNWTKDVKKICRFKITITGGYHIG